MNSRACYVEKLFTEKDNSNISVLTGMSKSGKSGIFVLLIKKLLNNNVDQNNITYLNFDKFKEENIKDSLKLYYYIQKFLLADGRKYLFLDDVEYIDRWERALKLLLDNRDLKIYLSSSNQLNFHNEFFLSGDYKYYITKLLPLSFKEFLELNNFEDNINKTVLFDEYIRKGSLPKIHQTQLREEDIKLINEGIYSSILLKEVLLKNKVGDFFILNNVIEIVAENLGGNISSNKISGISTAKGIKSLNKINPASRTVESHIEMLKSAYLIHELVRLDLLENRELKTLGKYYFNEIGFIECITGRNATLNLGILENVVFLELLRNNYTVYNGKIKEKYITFVAVKGENTKYIQVAMNLSDSKGVKKIVSPLLDMLNKGECIVIYLNNCIKINKHEKVVKFISIYDYLT